MKSILVLLICVFCAQNSILAQKGKKAPAKKTAAKGKAKTSKTKKGSKLKTTGDDELDIFTCYEGGGPCTFTILKGDTLVYSVNSSGKSYEMFVVANKFTSNVLADYSWYTTTPDGRNGKVQINANGLMKGGKYLLNLASGDTKLTDGSTIWLSEKSYKDIAAKTGAKMSIDNGAEETYNSPEADESNVSVKYKGNEILLEGFAIENAAAGNKGRNELSYMNVSDNLLLLKADLVSGSMILKEVRASKTR